MLLFILAENDSWRSDCTSKSRSFILIAFSQLIIVSEKCFGVDTMRINSGIGKRPWWSDSDDCDFNEIRTHGLCVGAVMLYQLSYEDQYIAGEFVEFILPVKGMNIEWRWCELRKYNLNENTIVPVVIVI